MSLSPIIVNYSATGSKSPITIDPHIVNGRTTASTLPIVDYAAASNTIAIAGNYSGTILPATAVTLTGTIVDGVRTVGVVEFLPSTSVFNIDVSAKQFQIPGNWVNTFIPNRSFAVEASTANNGRWIVKSAHHMGGYTFVTVKSSSTGDTVPWGYNNGDSLSGIVDGFVEVNLTVFTVVPALISTGVGGTIAFSTPVTLPATTLALPGAGVQHYGKYILENLVQMLESFCGTSSPVSPTEGQLWWDTTTLRVYDGSTWVAISSLGNTISNVASTNLTAIGGELTLAVPSFIVGASRVHVFVNRLKQINGIDYTETDPVTITFPVALNPGDIVEAIVYS